MICCILYKVYYISPPYGGTTKVWRGAGKVRGDFLLYIQPPEKSIDSQGVVFFALQHYLLKKSNSEIRNSSKFECS